VSTLFKMTWVELKLFTREPLTMIFSLAFPLFVLFILAGVFGNTAEPDEPEWRGVGPTDYYVPAYIALTIASMGLIALPVHLASYREQGVLRRFRASSVPAWSIFGSQAIVSFVITAIGSVLLTAFALIAYGTDLPESPAEAGAAFVLGTLSFVSLGVLLGALLPTARAAQGAGLILFFVMMFISGAGPPREVLSDTMHTLGDALPLTYVITLLQDPWLGFGWDVTGSLVVAGILIVSALLSVRFFRWE